MIAVPAIAELLYQSQVVQTVETSAEVRSIQGHLYIQVQCPSQPYDRSRIGITIHHDLHVFVIIGVGTVCIAALDALATRSIVTGDGQPDGGCIRQRINFLYQSFTKDLRPTMVAR